MTVTHFWECSCSCHRNKSIKHCRPCCYTCPYCGRHILRSFIEQHKLECRPKPNMTDAERIVEFIRDSERIGRKNSDK